MAYTTINKSSDFFNTKLYTGNSGTQAITGVGFQPDLVWTKGRNQSESHYWTDAVRGTNSQIYSNGSNAQGTASNVITAFGTDGFTLGNNSEVNGGYNYASWNWKAGTGQGSSNTDGSINTTYTSVNTTAGFSISKYTGTGSNATVGHGLGSTPHTIIVKRSDASDDWHVYHKSIGNTKALKLNTTDAEHAWNVYWNNTSPTSSVFSVGTGNGVNASSGTYIAYCFAEKQGYSKFENYKGNGNADGNFIYTGFKPAMVILKGASGSGSTENWSMYDNKRTGFNVDNNVLYPNATSAEGTSDDIDLLSNGFKIRRATGLLNDTAVTYIYMAFAEEPLVASNFVPATAR